MTPTTPVTRRYREIVSGGEYEIDITAIAETLLERLLEGKALPAAR